MRGFCVVVESHLYVDPFVIVLELRVRCGVVPLCRVAGDGNLTYIAGVPKIRGNCAKTGKISAVPSNF